jgi:hypothetical protein
MDDLEHTARALTRNQRDELRHHGTDWSRPKNAATARRMWSGISPLGGAHGVPGTPIFPLERRAYSPTAGARGPFYRLSRFGVLLQQALARVEGQ